MTSDRLARAIDLLDAAETCIVQAAAERPWRIRHEDALTQIATRARAIADRAEQAAANCAARREAMTDADRSIAAILNEPIQEAAE